jgi:hypothetical protein
MPASYPSPPGPELPDRSPTASQQNVSNGQFTEQELNALIAFFLLLDAWDKKKN